MAAVAWIVIFLVAMGVLAYQRASLPVATIGLGVLLLILTVFGFAHVVVISLLWLIFIAVAVPLNVLPLRRRFMTHFILKTYRHVMPTMSDTEKEALTAGGVGWTADLFSGMPDWHKFQKIPGASVSSEEQAFIDGPVEELCAMIDNWAITQRMDIPDNIWAFLKEHGFFGMIIPKEYGGLAFSATAHSEILVKVSGVSVSVATLIGVPNSLGPAELLLKYGTDEQKNHYLPRLARGEEIPCFALTSPVAGSDASALTDYGVVVNETFDGKEQLCIRLNWNKRYITLAPTATLLGLAFKLHDPDGLLSDVEERGITCALIPTQTKGVEVGRRHYPLTAAFPNGPTRGTDVIIPLSWVIGGEEMVGQGWRMLMECLAAGRAISLPSMVTGGAKRGALASGAYARIRRQFNTYIGRFGGVSESLARIAGNTMIMDALRLFSVAALDQNQRPVVASAISKYHTTELAREVAANSMDIHGGKGICMGPSNYLAQAYIEMPISITVEGANILTRSMIIFGQGAIRCHPFILPELTAAQDPDEQRSLHHFDRALFGHIGFILSNKVRSIVLGLTNGVFVRAPKGPLKRYYQHITRFSAVLATTADFCMLSLGGKLKFLERLSGRLGDLLSLLYATCSVLKYYDTIEVDGERKALLPVVEWSCQQTLYRLQTQLDGLLMNFPVRPLRWVLRLMVMPLGKRLKPPSDRLSREVADLLLVSSTLRHCFSKNIYTTPNDNNLIGQMEQVLHDTITLEPLLDTLRKAERDNVIVGRNFNELVSAATAANVVSDQDAQRLLAFDHARMAVINVDDFDPKDIVRDV